MKNIFVPNGIGPLKIIYNLARKEFGELIRKSNRYIEIKNDIVRALKRMKPDEYEEHKVVTLVEIEHIKQNDFGNFISLRFAYWALIITIAMIVVAETPIYVYFNVSKKVFGIVVMVFLTILLITMSRIIHVQHDRLEYLNFKLLCFEEIDKYKNEKVLNVTCKNRGK